MWTKIKLFLGAVGDFLAPIARLFADAAGGLLKDAALAAVFAIAKDPSMVKAGGLVKRQAAFDAIVTDLKGKGIQVGTQVAVSAVNMAIEAAYQKLKADGEITEK